MPYTLLKHRKTILLWIILTVVTTVITVALENRPTIAQTSIDTTQEIDNSAKVEEANSLFREAISLWRQGEQREALEQLEQAGRLYREAGDRHRESWSLLGLGKVANDSGDYAQALELYQQALVISREIGDRTSEGIALTYVGTTYSSLRDYSQALDYYQQALVAIREVNERAEEGNILAKIGWIYSALDQYQQALDYYQQALVIHREVGDRTMEGATLNYIGSMHDSLGQYPQALEYYEQSLFISREIGDRLVESGSLNNIALIHYRLGDHPKALDHYEQALSILHELDNRTLAGRLLNNIGYIYREWGNYSQALEYSQQALEIYREIGDRSGEGVTLNKIGLVYNDLGYYPQALEHYEQALAIRREIGDRSGEGATLNNIGITLIRQGDYSHALDLLHQSLIIRREIGDRSGEATTLNSIGTIYLGLADYSQALIHYQEALTINREIGDRELEGVILHNTGVVYRQLGQYAQALDYSRQALTIRREIGDRAEEGNTLNSIGVAHDKMGNYSEALNYYEQALSINREIGNRATEAVTLINAGLTYAKLGNYSQSLNYYEQALNIAREVGHRKAEGVAFNNMGGAYDNLGNYPKALENYQRALDISRKIGDRAGEGGVLNNIGRLLEETDEPELAIIFLKHAVNTFESIRQSNQQLTPEQQESYTDSISFSYEVLADLLLQQDRVLEAQEVVDLLKLQELDELKLQPRGNEETAQGLDMWPAEQQILDRYSQLIQQDPTTDFNAFINSPDIQALVEQLRRNAQGQNLNPAQLEKLQDNLQQLGNAALLYPLVLDDRLELILVTTAGISRHTVAVDRPQLNRAILDFRADITDHRSDPIPNARRLYTWLMDPIAADLEAAGADTILYAADGQLRYIPLAALHDGDQWLTQRYTINHITAASLTDFSRGEDRDLQILAGAFSDPGKTYDFSIGDKQFQFNGLPFAGVEVDAIATDIPNTQAYFDQDFSRANVEPNMGDYSIVHFATHAEFVPGFPHESFILFGNGDRVSLRDISEWSLPNTDLVVLSACRTAVSGELGGGEEILGFGYQVQRTGARAAIASLWYVDDSGTQSLMTTFYTALQNGYSETEALRQAQIALVTNDFATVNQSPRGITLEPIEPPTQNTTSSTQNTPNTHPYYWAPFILIGNGL